MPANLPPQYHEAEQRYRQAKTTAEKMACLQEMLAIIPKHKGTEKMQADLRRRLSKLRAAAQAGKRAGKRDSAFYIDKEGAGQVIIVGPPNVGKSALVASLTNATPEVADFPFTTWQPTPGMMAVEDIQVQLIDTPPLNRDYVEPELFGLIRRADIVVVVVNLETDPVEQLEDTVAILEEQRIVPLHRRDRFGEERAVTAVPFLVLANKCDNEGCDDYYEIFRELIGDEWPVLPISATTGRNADRLKKVLFEMLEIIRVYSKAPGREPDLDAPFVLDRGSTVGEFAAKVHQDFAEKLKMARVWGSGAFDGQVVSRDYVLHDGDVVELHI